jgi:hypothetical protein
LNQDAASGVDGVTAAQYQENLEENIQALVRRLKTKCYRAKLVRRCYPKENGKGRPLGIPALEDKLVQLARAKMTGDRKAAQVPVPISGLSSAKKGNRANHTKRRGPGNNSPADAKRGPTRAPVLSAFHCLFRSLIRIYFPVEPAPDWVRVPGTMVAGIVDRSTACPSVNARPIAGDPQQAGPVLSPLETITRLRSPGWAAHRPSACSSGTASARPWRESRSGGTCSRNDRA